MHHKKPSLCALSSSLAGFLFGFDTVVTYGAEQIIQTLWDLNSTVHGLAISMALCRGNHKGGLEVLLWIPAISPH
jgi:hypothetical protein